MIFVISTLCAGYLIVKHGILDIVIKLIGATSKIAKAVIGAAVYAIAATIGSTFASLYKAVNKFMKKIFS